MAARENYSSAYSLIFETPAEAPLNIRTAAHVALLGAILAACRSYMSYAQKL